MTLVAVAGDIATSGAGDTATAALITSKNPTWVVTLGDNAYNSGSTTEFTNYYQPTWGAFKSKTHPCPGNHDWGTGGAAGYKAYFGSSNVTNTDDGGTYYSWDTGKWHFVSIDISSYSGGGGTVPYTVGSAQYNWLAADLAAAKAAGQHSIVYDHFPRYSSGTVHGSTPEMANLWTLMANNGVVIFFSGHEHSYERFAPMNASGAQSTSGVRQVVVGTGGAGLYGFVSTPVANSVFRLSTWGVLFLDLQDTSYSATFYKTDGTVADSWTQTLGTAPPPALVDSPEALLENVGSATGRRYAAKDSANISMDCAKIIEKTAADGGGYLAVYQYLSGGTTWQVRLADSTDLLNWTFRTTLGTDESQPTIYRHPTAGYFTGCEYNAGAGGQLRIRRYVTLAALLANTPTHTFTAARSLSACNEGTPNFYSVTLSPDIDHAIIDIGHHYHWNCDVDRQARGTLTNWTTWTTSAQTTIDNAVIAASNSGTPISLVRQGVRTAVAGTSTTQSGLTSTAGNLLVATVLRGGGASATVNSITDSGGNSWTKISEGSVSGGSDTYVSIWYAQGANAITSMTLNGSGTWTWGLNLSEWSGALSSGPLDGGSGGGTTTSPILTPTFTPTSGDLVIAAVATDATSAVKDTLNFTSLTDFTNGTTLGRAAYVVEATGDQQVSWTPGTGFSHAGVAIAGFKRSTLGGNIGDRDNFTYGGNDWLVIEGQGKKNDFGTWRTYLYNTQQGTAKQLAPVTAAGSTAFANPTATVLTSPTGKTALVVTYFIPSQGAGLAEAGTLIYYTDFTGAGSGTGAQLTLPTRGIFYYPWFPEAWNQLGINPATKYNPTLGYYSTVNVLNSHVASMVYGGFNLAIHSWWGQGSKEDTRLPLLLNAAQSTGLKVCPYYEAEGNAISGVTGSPSPTTTQITSDLNYIAANYINHPAYAWVNGKPLLFVYGDVTDSCAVVDRWIAANNAATTKFYLVLKVFAGYASCTNQPDNWHQYGPAVQVDQQGTHSVNISPGFYLFSETTPRLARDLTAWKTAINTMNAASADFKLVTSFNEWGEGSSVESASQWSSTSTYGTYLDALHTVFGSTPGSGGGTGGPGGGSGGSTPVVTEHTGSAVSGTGATASGFTTTGGALLVAIVARSGGLATGALTGITDSAGNTWTMATRGAVSGTSNTRIEIWYTTNAPSVTSIVFASGTAQTWAWNILEVTNMATASALDVASIDGSSVTASSTINTTTITTLSSADLVVAAFHSPTATVTTPPASPWTNLGTFDDGTNLARGAYRIGAPVGNYSAAWALGSSVSAGVITVAFKQATATTGTGGGTTTATYPKAGHNRTAAAWAGDDVARMQSAVDYYGPFQAGGGTYHPVGSNPLDSAEDTWLTQIGTLGPLWVKWKPSSNWANVAAGGIDATLDAVALDIKSKAPTNIWLTIWHEPENDFGVANQSAADYVGMWQRVRTRFNAQAVTNVTWVWMVMGDTAAHASVLPSLWPGDTYVDVVAFDPYGIYNGPITGTADKMLSSLDWLAANEATNRHWGYRSKPQAMGEWGTSLNGDDTDTHCASSIDEVTNILPQLADRNVVRMVYFDGGGHVINTGTVASTAYKRFKDATEAGQVPTTGGGGGGGGTTTPLSGYDFLSVSYDSIDFSYDGTGAIVVLPPPPPVVPPPPVPPVEILSGTRPSVPFATTKLYVVATYTKAGKRVAVLPYTNLQMEFLLNEPSNCRLSLPIQHSAVTRANIEEAVHEVWVYRKGELIFSGPIWGIDTNSDGSSLQVTAQDLLSYFRYRLIDKDMLWITTNTGPGIATYLVMWTQTKSYGGLGITVQPGMGTLAANVGTALGYKLSYRWWEQKFVYDAIKDLADNVATGFDFEITPQRVFNTGQPELSSAKPGLLRYPTHFQSYYFPRFGMQVTNDYTIIGPGDGAATLFGNAINTRSMAKYGLMEGTGSWGDSKTRAALNAKATKYVKEHGAPISIPAPVLRGNVDPFLGTYRPGDRIRLQINNGYDQVDRTERMTGYQLTVGPSDEETVNVYFNIEEASIVG